MNLDSIEHILQNSQGFENTVGMQFFSTPEQDTCMGKMYVGKHLLQPMGYLSGGAILALGETLAGVGSMALCPQCKCVGISVSANHMFSAREGQTVTALGHLIHRGVQTHVWRIDITNESGRLLSTVNVTNFVKPL